MKINQNISAVIVNDQLLRNENSVSASVKRLSSGLKFNDPKDNPSGMAISFKMQAQIHALNRASLNATDGTSMVETIDGAMGEMTEVLQRIRELCVQAANDTNTDEDREAIQQEIDALKEEVNRISTATEFNGKTLMDGSLDRRTYVTSKQTVTQGTNTVTKDVSMFDKITNVIISDEVPSDLYNVTIVKTADHANLTATGDASYLAPGTVITEEEAGIVRINGSRIEIKEGMSANDVYAALRDGGEKGWVNVFATTTPPTQGPITGPEQLDTQGYPEQTSGYKFGDTLAFVSQNYGSDETITITCDNAGLAKVLGIDQIQNVEVTEAYSLETTGADKDGTSITDKPARITTNNVSFTDVFESSGTIIINDISIAIEKDMRVDDAYLAIQTALTGVITVAATGGSSLEFETLDDGADQKISIQYDTAEIGRLLGFNSSQDVNGDPLTPDGGVLSYKVKVEGEDAEVSIEDNNNEIRPEYTGQAVVQTDGNQVVITDKSGFKMSFEVRGDVTYDDQGAPKSELITIEATDIGTLQLQIGANEGQELAVRVPILNTQSLYMDDLDVRKVGGPDRGIEAMDTAIGIVTAARSLMGAYENRLDYVRSGLDEAEENMTTAISRLGDVDMAKEMTDYTNANVLTQASISVLAQANDLPQQVLSLLQ